MMAALLPGAVIGVLTFTLMLAILLFWGGLIFIPVMLIKLLLPLPAAQRVLGRALTAIASRWVGSNQVLFRLLHAPAWNLQIDAQLDPHKSYLLVCNHQSWADILVLFDLMHGRTHFLRFFLKRELIWIPLVGIICWALDMPFMKRHSREAVAANPRLRDEDLATTRRFCEKYRRQPITVVNFVEGTRCTPAKRAATGSPFRHLLRPKSAGLSFTLNAMGEQFGGILDITLAYQPSARPLLWSWMCGEQSQLAARVELLPIPQDLIHGDYESDPAFRARFQEWVNGLWAEKDSQLDRLRRSGAVSTDLHAT